MIYVILRKKKRVIAFFFGSFIPHKKMNEIYKMCKCHGYSPMVHDLTFVSDQDATLNYIWIYWFYFICDAYMTINLDFEIS